MSDQQQELADVLSELTDAICRGEIVDFESVCRQHPLIVDELRELWGAILVTDAAGATRSTGDPLADSLEAISLPVTIGDYELIEEIGRGGMGVVFRASQVSLDREIAIKMILRGRLADDSDRQRFTAEATATAKLEHPNIVPVYEVGEIGGRPFFSMKYVKGRTLAELIDRDPIDEREAARIVAAIARATHFAHEQGVLHRDLKPSNILLDDNRTALVSDFGLAKQLGATNDLTRSGLLLGTPAYMSPEQASGRRDAVGPASDVYSLGCILYFALTGQAPFRADSPMELAMLVIEQDPPPPRTLRPTLSRDLEMIVVRCLQKPADLRYASAAALADDLDAFLADEEVLARSGHFNQIIARTFRETHHIGVLENWGLLWMWHSLVLLLASVMTWVLNYQGVTNRSAYIAVWVVGVSMWATVFWRLRQRMGPVTFVERQIAHVWGASIMAIATVFPLEWWLGLPVLELAPLLAVISAMVFVIKGGILTGMFYFQAAAMLITAVLMAVFPDVAHLTFGSIAAICFFIPGLKYERRRRAGVSASSA